jgi:PAS domain-containing protein
VGGLGSGQKSVVLILARELASNIATPMLVLDRDGTLVFYNEPAEIVFGARFDEIGEIAAEVWDSRWPVSDADGNPISLLESELANVIIQHTPGHQSIRVQGLDGVRRAIEATAFPLFDSMHTFVGAVAVFWQTENGHGPAGASPVPERTGR